MGEVCVCRSRETLRKSVLGERNGISWGKLVNLDRLPKFLTPSVNDDIRNISDVNLDLRVKSPVVDNIDPRNPF